MSAVELEVIYQVGDEPKIGEDFLKFDGFVEGFVGRGRLKGVFAVVDGDVELVGMETKHDAIIVLGAQLLHAFHESWV